MSLKVCRTCRIAKPIREYDLPRHRVCTACRAKGVTVHRGTPEQASAGTTIPSITTHAGYKMYYRLRARALASGTPPPKRAKFPLPKKCRRCQRVLTVDHFAHPRFRLCKTCDV